VEVADKEIALLPVDDLLLVLRGQFDHPFLLVQCAAHEPGNFLLGTPVKVLTDEACMLLVLEVDESELFRLTSGWVGGDLAGGDFTVPGEERGKFLGVKSIGETSDVDVSVVLLLESLIFWDEVLSLNGWTRQNCRIVGSHSFYSLLSFLNIPELHEPVPLGHLLSGLVVVADLGAFDFSKLAEVLAELHHGDIGVDVLHENV
jgi:hypothetical protein